MSENNADKAKAEKKVIAGPAIAENTVTEQAKDARKIKDKPKDDGGKVDGAAKSAADAASTPEMKLKDAAKKAKQDHLESIGLSRRAASEPAGAGMSKVEDADTKDDMYSGVVTCTGYSGEYHQKVSQRIDIGATPRGWGWLEYAFTQHFGAAAVLEDVDPENKDDPLLRTTYG